MIRLTNMLGQALACLALSAAAAQANEIPGSSISHPGPYGDGGCGEIYFEDRQGGTAWVGFAVPALDDGASIEIMGQAYQTGPYPVTFTCTGGTISAGNFWGTWIY